MCHVRYKRLGILFLALLMAGCATQRVRLAENRPAYSRAEGENARAPVVRVEPPLFNTFKEIADSYLGVPYLWGGNGPDSIDCSAFTQQVFQKAYSLELPRRATWQSELGFHVFKYGVRKGDLLFFGVRPDSIDHVGIYMGDGKFINATVSSGVKYSSLDETFWLTKYQFARRIPLPMNLLPPRRLDESYGNANSEPSATSE